MSLAFPFGLPTPLLDLEQDRTIILAVIPSNVDIATVDILTRAEAVDPEGKRTIGVLTKPDLIDEGGEEEAVSVIEGVRKPLNLGCRILTWCNTTFKPGNIFPVCFNLECDHSRHLIDHARMCA